MDARILLHGLTPAKIAALAQVSVHTARRWKRSGHLPHLAFRLLELVTHGELGALAPAWRGWSLRDGKLITPEGWAVRPGDVRAIPYRLHQVRELERALAEPQQWSLFVAADANSQSRLLRPARASDAGAGAAAAVTAPPGPRARRARSRSTACSSAAESPSS